MTTSLNTLTDDEVIYALAVGDGRFHCATRRLGCSRRALRERIRASSTVREAYLAILKKRRHSLTLRHRDGADRHWDLFDNLDLLSERWGDA